MLWSWRVKRFLPGEAFEDNEGLEGSSEGEV